MRFRPLKELRQFREENNLSQQLLAESLGVTPAAVSRWETGERRPDRSYIPHLASMTGIDLMTLLGV
jgi:transcriptional regulator with XRE-family HTH domain